MWHDYSIQYKNVLLRPLTEEDIEYLREWRNSKQQTAYLSRVDYITPEAQKAWFIHCMDSDDNITFAIIDIVRNRFVGSIALYDFKSTQAELGRLMVGDPEAHGKHIGRNSVWALSLFAFDQLKLDRVILHVYKDNVPALKIYSQAGYRVTSEHVSNGLIEYAMVLKKGDFCI